jgi:hypothetical protein
MEYVWEMFSFLGRSPIHGFHLGKHDVTRDKWVWKNDALKTKVHHTLYKGTHK